MKPLRPYQQDAIHMLRQSLMSGCSRPVLQLATGAGKTRLAAELAALNAGGSVLLRVAGGQPPVMLLVEPAPENCETPV